MTFEKAFKNIRDLFQRKAEQGVFTEKEINDFNRSAKEIADYYNDKEGKKKNIQMPWTDEEFLTMWKHWKNYKKEEFNFKYKSMESEQAALSKLAKLSDGHMNIAIAIIKQSIENGWKGFYALKGNKNQGKPGMNSYKQNIANRLINGGKNE
ncbi:MAG: hypothetical protein ACOCYO_06895 [Bacteroidota bacterium]